MQRFEKAGEKEFYEFSVVEYEAEARSLATKLFKKLINNGAIKGWKASCKVENIFFEWLASWRWLETRQAVDGKISQNLPQSSARKIEELSKL